MRSEFTVVDWIAIITFVLSIIGGIGWALFMLGGMHYMIKRMEKMVDKISPMDFKMEILWRDRTTVSHSPRVLNTPGRKILNDSKIDQFTTKYYNEIVDKVGKTEPKNAYDLQENLITVMRGLKKDETYRMELEQSMSDTSCDIDTLLFVAAIDVRDRVITDFNFKRIDIEKNDPSKNFK